jgi:CxxC motif-containing protein
VPVRSAEALPKGILFEVAALLREVELKAPVSEHQVVIGNVMNTGVNIITSRALLWGEEGS